MAGRGDGNPGTSDGELVGAVRQGSSEAFESLVRRHIRAAYSFAMSIVEDGDEADDICQDAFISALRRIEQLREPERFRSWLMSIVRNRALNVRSFQSRRAGPSVDEMALPSEEPGPESDLKQREIGEEVLKAAEGLTKTQRRVFILHDLEGFDHAEIARSLGISRGASRVHLHMARRVMRGSMHRDTLEGWK